MNYQTYSDPSDNQVSDYIPDCTYSSWTALNNVVSNNRCLSILTINVRILIGKFPELCSYLSRTNKKFTFIVVVETWLNADKDKALELNGYKSYSIYRDCQIGGGIKIYYLEHIVIDILEEFTGILPSGESVSFAATINGCGKVNLIAVYRPPSKPIAEFFNQLSSMLQHVGNNCTVLTGDFNINSLSNDLLCNEYINLMTSFGFVNEINIPTYVSPITGSDMSCIDHLWHNYSFSTVTNSYVIKTALSDHYAIFCIFNLDVDKRMVRVKFRDFSNENMCRFNNKFNWNF